jgi:CheY-like chemotaxis protein
MYNKGNMTKILLVEDDKSLREIYGVRLLAEGYDIVSAGDGEQALAMAIKERPQLIVSDVMMPKISGFDMLDILRSTTETKDIKVIMMTALSSEDQRARGVALGADRYLVKSQVGIEDVVRTVHEVIGDAPVSGQAFGSATPSAAPRPAQNIPPRPVAAPTAQQPAAPVAPRPIAAAPPRGTLPQQPAPAFQPAVSNSNSSMPQPTAPFSTTRPANLGERIIHPISQPANPSQDISSLMDQELNSTAQQPPAAPAMPPLPPTPPVPTMPQQNVSSPSSDQNTPTAPQPAPPMDPSADQDIDIGFEETPRPTGPSAPGGQPPTA